MPAYRAFYYDSDDMREWHHDFDDVPDDTTAIRIAENYAKTGAICPDVTILRRVVDLRTYKEVRNAE